ncbi:MAG: spore coat protein U domain-containing protein [Geminicoccaceae bacterium]
MSLNGPLVIALLSAACWTGPALAVCSVDTEPVAFGIADPQRQTRGTGEVVIHCDATTTITVGLSPGGGGSGGRRMRGSTGGRIDYYLFSDAGNSVPWGDGAAIGNPVTASAEGGIARRLTIYGVIPAQDGIDAGEYDDSLQVTLTF